jgi:hypothetical protein
MKANYFKRFTIMLYLVFIPITCILISCNNEVPDVKLPEQFGTNMYYGKVMLSQEGKKALLSMDIIKPYTIPILIGNESTDAVGDSSHNAKTNNVKKDEMVGTDSTIKEMLIAGDLLEKLKNTDPVYLDHLYVKYYYTTETTGSGTGIIVSLKTDLLDKTPLEKVTIYTVEKKTSQIITSSTKDSTKNSQSSLPAGNIPGMSTYGNIYDTVNGKKVDTAAKSKDTIQTKKKPR